jgi:hypothetical protein
VFTPEDRHRLRQGLLDRARRDRSVTGAALTGSAARSAEDRWSDVDLFLGIAPDADLSDVIEDWTRMMYEEENIAHHWDLRSDSAVYRVFLLTNCLHVDIAFTPESDFDARGPGFDVVVGTAVETRPARTPNVDDVAGLGWLGVLHAHAAIERELPWQAEHWVAAVREQTLSLACLRHGVPAVHGRGTDRLPTHVTRPLEATFVSRLTPGELQRALRAATACFLEEVRWTDPRLAKRLEPPLTELAGG